MTYTSLPALQASLIILTESAMVTRALAQAWYFMCGLGSAPSRIWTFGSSICSFTTTLDTFSGVLFEKDIPTLSQLTRAPCKQADSCLAKSSSYRQWLAGLSMLTPSCGFGRGANSSCHTLAALRSFSVPFFFNEYNELSRQNVKLSMTPDRRTGMPSSIFLHVTSLVVNECGGACNGR